MSVSRLYLHGLPGSSLELELLAEEPGDLLVMDRNGYKDFTAMSQDLGRYSGGTALHLIGFSLGAHAALRLAAAAPDKVARLTLVSPAAPLELGRFLPDMAGSVLFRLARSRILFSGVSALQRMAALRAPGTFASKLLQTTDLSDRALFESADARRVFERNLLRGFETNFEAYRREIPAYVRPWAERLGSVRCPVTIWHGTADQWSPPAMAEALRDALPGQVDLHWGEDLGHCSTLVQNAPRIF